MGDHKRVLVMGYASSEGGPNAGAGCEKGPMVLKNSHYLTRLRLPLDWKNIIQPSGKLDKLDTVAEMCQELAISIEKAVRSNQHFLVIGGDHTSAIGTWSGAQQGFGKPLGLIWVDAHMDSHTPQTTPSGNIHGMPLAALLGFGETKLTHILHDRPKLLPENICLIGVRSYERGEAELLNRLNVRIYYMDEIAARGMDLIMKDAIAWVTDRTEQFGISLDVDSIDPLEAPGTDVIEPDGISARELIHSLRQVAVHPKWIGAEIVEFDPRKDHNQMTEKLICDMISALFTRK